MQCSFTPDSCWFILHSHKLLEPSGNGFHNCSKMLGRYYVFTGWCCHIVEPRRWGIALQQTFQQCQVKARIQGRFWRVMIRSWNLTTVWQTSIMQWSKDTPPVWQDVILKNVQSRKWQILKAFTVGTVHFNFKGLEVISLNIVIDLFLTFHHHAILKFPIKLFQAGHFSKIYHHSTLQTPYSECCSHLTYLYGSLIALYSCQLHENWLIKFLTECLSQTVTQHVHLVGLMVHHCTITSYILKIFHICKKTFWYSVCPKFYRLLRL